ncbi:MAG TPA: acetyl-CoA carboxylase biotin carboxyl carrier protein [Acidobacteriota bacterium]|nr:acetyl-CoA carboxylase biotin carboxyl carrier protein [Acidobacteriota bacterium]
MSEKYIRKLIRLVEESEIESLEVSSWGRRIRITQRNAASSNGDRDAPAVVHTAQAVAPAVSQVAPVDRAAAPPAPETVEDTGRLVEIKSPMVGTFYAAPSPESDAYVSQNEKITSGQVVCIVEAMKLMNEIESEVSGRVVKILGENGKPVEFGQVLFLIDLAG